MASFYSLPKTDWLSASDFGCAGDGAARSAKEACEERPNGERVAGSGAVNGALATPSQRRSASAGPCALRGQAGTNGAYNSGARGSQDSAAVAARPPSGSPLTLYGKSVRRAALLGVDASSELNSATSVQYRLKRAILASSDVQDVLAVVERSLAEFDYFQCTLAVHRLARHGRGPRAQEVLGHPSWPGLAEKLRSGLHSGEPRQLASAAWAFANLHVRDGDFLESIADGCLRRDPGRWDAMSLSLVVQSFALLGARHPPLFASVSAQVQRELSASWPPGDISRVVWACARLLHRDDGLFRDASCKSLARLPEFTPTVLAQTVWAFATLGPPTVTSHFFPHAADAMMGPGLVDHSAAHLAMVAWSFAAVLFRPVPLLEAIGDVVPQKEEQLNSQDITMIAWAYATLLAPQRRVFGFLATAAARSVRAFNAQDLSNTAWAFATAGEYAADMLDAVAEEACRRSRDFSCQHVAMLIWAFVTLRHQHGGLFETVGSLARVDLSSWHSTKLLAYALAGLPKLRAQLGTLQATQRVARELVVSLQSRIRRGEGEPDDAHTVHDAVFPWRGGSSQEDADDEAAWTEVDSLVATQRERVQQLVSRSSPFEAILQVDWWVYDERVVREYQCSVQALGLRGLGSVHTWRLLASLGLRRAPAEELAARAAAARAAPASAGSAAPAPRAAVGQDAGRGERANWCFWRARVEVPTPADGELAWHVVEERGRLQNSTVVGYREDSGGLVAVKLSHDHVSHRAWDCEFRAMARTAAAARALLAGLPGSRAEALLDTGASDPSPPTAVVPSPAAARLAAEASVQGRLEIYMTEVPCLSCVCAMAQFRRRFRNVELHVAWDGMPP